MARPRKAPTPVRLEVHYEHAPERQFRQAIMILAAMYRDAMEQPAQEPVQRHVERIILKTPLVYNMESPS